MRFLENLSLRQRFLVAPIFGVALIALLTVAFGLEASRQNDLLDRLAGEDLLRIQHHTTALNDLTRHHLRLYALFTDAGGLDEAALYDQSKAGLDGIREALRRLDESLHGEAHALDGSAMEHHEEIHALGRAYLDEIASAVAMSTVDTRYAPVQMARASASFSAMGEDFVRLLDREQKQLDVEIDGRIRDNRAYTISLAVGGGLCAILLLVMARGFASLLGRSLGVQIDALTELGAQAGSTLAVAGQTELARIASAIGAFRASLLELRRARDELEQRVEERTRDLQKANEETRAHADALSDSLEQFHRNERSLNAIVEFIGEAIVTIDETGIVQTFNPAAERTFGYEADEVVGRNVSILLPQQEVAGQAASANGAALFASPATGDTRDLKGRRKDDSLFDIELSVSAMTFEGRRRFIGVCNDVTARREAEESLRRAKEQAEAANYSKSAFLATMSHEIRTPMNGVIGMSELMLETSLDDDQRQYAAAISRSANALLTIINDVLDFSKLEAGRFDLDRDDFNTIDVVEDVAELMRPRALEPGIDLVTFVAPNVPRFVNGDAGRLRQVLLNLAGNAVKFTPTGCVAITSAVARIDRDRVTIRYEVIDTGIGIAEDAKANLFERFTQADASTTRQYGGTGLGLAISRQIVELMGGEIGVESKPGAGSTFWFTAPFGNAAPDAGGEDVPLSDLSGLRVLVVDDIELNRTIFARQLASWGVEVVCASGGEAALAAIDRSVAGKAPFDAAILDHAMPGMDGEALASRIAGNAASAGIRLILASSLDLRTDAERLKALGFSVCLCKPVRQKDLQMTLAEVCSRPSAVVRRKAAEESARPAVETSGEPGEPGAPRPVRILLAEDNRTNQMLVVAILKKYGYAVDIAENGVEAVHAVRHALYDLVLMDVNMPEMDGLAATAAIRAMDGDRGQVPIVALTANAMAGDRERFLAAGMDDYMSKPIDREKLVAIVATIGASALGRPGDADATANDGGSAEVLDLAIVDDWRSFLAEDAFNDMVDVQIADSRDYLEQLREAVERGDIETMGKLAHDLKSSAGSIGMIQVHRIAEQMEHACRTGRRDEALPLGPDLDVAVGRATNALKARLAV